VGLYATGLAGLALLVSAPPAAPADQVHFTGETTAGEVLIRDTLQTIAQFAYSSRNCRSVSAVEARILPEDYVPANPQYRLGTGKVVRETWTATLCGEKTRFLISFWPDGKGGTFFGIGYPYPDDAP
jgi:hypothetical protein